MTTMRTREEYRDILRRILGGHSSSIDIDEATFLYVEERSKAGTHIANLKIAFDLAARRADDAEAELIAAKERIAELESELRRVVSTREAEMSMATVHGQAGEFEFYVKEAQATRKVLAKADAK